MSNEEVLSKLDIEKDLHPWMQHYLDWHTENVKEVLASEKIVVHPDGYAGTTDLYCVLADGSRALVDYKTQGVKDGNKPRFYDSWIYQLVAYRACFEDYEDIKCVSVILNSNNPEPLTHKVWSDEDVERAEKVFGAALTIWQNKKKYKPENENGDD
jgi:hypothetical protein